MEVFYNALAIRRGDFVSGLRSISSGYGTPSAWVSDVQLVNAGFLLRNHPS